MPRYIKTPQTFAIMMICFLQGCALINPHVSWQRPDPPISLDQAIKYAYDGREAYKQGVATYTTVPNVLALGLIPLGAGAIGAGFGGARPETIGYLALAGAGAFALGQWFNNPLRQDVYIAGMNGITCAVEAVLPLKIDKTSLKMGLDQMRNHGGKAEGHAREVARLVAEIEADGPTSQTKAATQSLASAKEVIERAQQTLADGYALMDLHERAGELLTTKIEQIDILVTKQIKSTQPDVDSLRLLVQGLGQSARTLIPVTGKASELLGGEGAPKTIQPQSLEKTRRDKLQADLDKEAKEMNLAVSQLSAETGRVQAIVNSAVRSRPSETLKKCGVEEIELAFNLDPPTALTLPRGKFVSVTVTGGKAPYSARLEPQPAEGVTILARDAGDRTFNIAASADAPTQEYALRIEDALRNVQRTKVTIVEAPATTKPPPPSASPPAPTGVPNKTASVLDEQRLREFASAIQ
ncbi:MAG TPA: hypothetical protein VHV54_23655, partial [Candidatus Binatia bacterium]|nr:hypothetical protein [Candidatus Binatia bacterium]